MAPQTDKLTYLASLLMVKARCWLGGRSGGLEVTSGSVKRRESRQEMKSSIKGAGKGCGSSSGSGGVAKTEREKKKEVSMVVCRLYCDY